jgi:glycosyltransferase involved in cell wall biosynthesis
MKVAFDASAIAFKEKTGTGVYAEEFLKAYEKCFSEEDQIIHTYRLSRRIRGRKFLRPLSKNISRSTLIDPVTSFKGRGYDIFHGLNTRLPILQHSKLVATIHDLFSIFGAFSALEFKEDQTIKINQMLARAHHIIVPATVIKNQFVSQLGYDSKKLSVIPLGVRPSFLVPQNKSQSQKVVGEKLGINNPFIFFVGALEKRKNVAGLVGAFARYVREYKKPLDLVLGGHPGFEFEKIQTAIENSGCKERIKILGFVDVEVLRHLYGGCEIFVLPSFEEGYGIPIIEAMACGAPVISSNTTSLPEVGNGFSWLVDPHSPEQISRAMSEILSPSPQALEKIKGGVAYAQTMSWEKVAKSTRKVYENLVENP